MKCMKPDFLHKICKNLHLLKKKIFFQHVNGRIVEGERKRERKRKHEELENMTMNLKKKKKKFIPRLHFYF